MTPGVKPTSQYGSVYHDLRTYLSYYGGMRVFFTSPFTHVAVLVSIICSRTWLGDSWSDLPISVLPSLLGFALAAYALLFAFGDESFRTFLATVGRPDTQGGEDNLLLHMSSIFLHFIVVQILALLLAIIGHAHFLSFMIEALKPALAFNSCALLIAHAVREIYAFVSFTMFNLAITTSLASALNIFHSTQWYAKFKQDQKQKNEALKEKTP